MVGRPQLWISKSTIMLRDFLDFFYQNYFLFAYAITLVISLYNYRKYFDTRLKYLPVIIAYTFFNELLGYMIRYYPNFSLFEDLKQSPNNEIIYNIYDVVFFSFFYCLYWKLIVNLVYKKWICSMAILSLCAYVVSCFFQNPIMKFLYYAYAIASWGLIFCIILYFKDKKHPLQTYNLAFWVSLGLLVFFSVAPYLLLVGYLDYPTWVKYNFRIVLHVFIILMYTLFSIGFVRSTKKVTAAASPSLDS